MLPIVQRELQTASRRGVVYRSRYLCGAIAGMAALASLLWADLVWKASNAPGIFLFLFITAVAGAFALSAGFFLTLDAIISEKRQGTLGLLFLTELRGYDIVLGKFVSSTATAASAFITCIPILALSLCLGGVTGTQFWQVVLASATLLFLSLSFGLFLSAICERHGVAMLLFFLVAVTCVGITFLQLSYPSAMLGAGAALNPLLPILNATGLLERLPPPLSVLAKQHFLTSILYSWLSAVGFLVAASILLPLGIRKQPTLRRRWFRSRVQARHTVVAREEALHSHPVLWLSVRDKWASLSLWVLIGVASSLLFWDPLNAVPGVKGLTYPLVLHYLLKIFLMFQAVKLVSQEKETGFLELLLTTPLSSGVILRSKRAALRRHFLFPVVYIVAVHGIFILSRTPSNEATAIAALSMIILFMDYFSLSWLAFWKGLCARTSARAFANTFFTGLLLPWLPFLLVTSFIWFLLDASFQLPPSHLLLLGVVSAAIFSLGLGLYGMARVHYNLRLKIAEG